MLVIASSCFLEPFSCRKSSCHEVSVCIFLYWFDRGSVRGRFSSISKTMSICFLFFNTFSLSCLNCKTAAFPTLSMASFSWSVLVTMIYTLCFFPSWHTLCLWCLIYGQTSAVSVKSSVTVDSYFLSKTIRDFMFLTMVFVSKRPYLSVSQCCGDLFQVTLVIQLLYSLILNCWQLK